MESAVVDLLIGKVAAILENEAKLLGGVRDQLDELKLELASMNTFLRDADKKNGLTDGEKEWVANVRDMCDPVEDIIEEFMYHMNKPKKVGKFARLVNWIINQPKNLIVRHQVAKKIEDLNKKLKSIPERNQRYGVTRVRGAFSHEDDQRRQAQYQSESLVYAKDDHIVGIADDKRQLLEWLTDMEQERTVISVVGMGGSGKSTLVAKVYSTPAVISHFHCYAWITVSQTYAVDEVLKSIIKKFYHAEQRVLPIDLNYMECSDLLAVIVDYLQPKRYLVVLDDVWSIDLWKDMKVALPNEGTGSRVILTTRHETIATNFFGVTSHVHYIKPLNQKEAWDLFSNAADLSNPHRAFSEELGNIARKLVLKCKGLPLAILALGGALRSKKLVSEWMDFSNSLNQELSSNDAFEEVKQRILLASFKDLSYQLKRCFLYCCIFPEDYPFKRTRLIRLWMAEGFVEEDGENKPESLADGYLRELVQRNMIQVVQRHPSGRPEACKMHDMMLELAIWMSKKEKFCVVHDGLETSKGMSILARRLSIHSGAGLQNASPLEHLSQLRSLLLFVTDLIPPYSSANTFPPGFRLLRVLDLQGLPIEKLPEGVVDLFNLRYLNLRSTKVKDLPESIGRLRNLQTLDIRNSRIRMLPARIGKLEKLRHLLMYHKGIMSEPDVYGFSLSTSTPSSICKLKNLQILDSINAEPNLLKGLKNMTQLTTLGITNLRKEDEQDLCTAIVNMKHLERLGLLVTDGQEYLGIQALSSAPPRLDKLVLGGKLEKVPSWLQMLHSLTRLELHWSRMSEDPLPYLQALGNLSGLTLSNSYTGDHLCFSTGFNNLKMLTLEALPRLKHLEIEKGVMPSLHEMSIYYCKALTRVPDGIEHLMQLQELRLEEISNEVIERIQGETSLDRPRVRHIPVIKHYYMKGHYESLSNVI